MASYIEINDLGSFASINALWAAHPEGGQEGDYCTIDGVKYRWDKYDRMWVADPNFGPTPARSVTTFDGDVNMQNNLTVAGDLRAKRIKQPCLGLFASLPALEAKWPEPEVGMWAVVGDALPGAPIYRCNTEADGWEATGGTASIDALEFNIALGVTGWVPITSPSQLPLDPTEEQQGRGYLVGTMLYVYVGTGGDTLGGKYQSAQLKGFKGDQGNPGFQGDFDDFELVNNLTEGGEEAGLTAEQGKRLKQITDGIVATGFDEYTTNSEVKVVDDISTATSKWSGPNNVHINGAPADAFFSKDGTVTSVTFQTKQISGIDPGKTVTFKAWDKDAGTVRVLGSLESSALDTIETFAVSWQMYAGEYLMVYGNISCTGATGDTYNTYKVDYNEGTGVVTSVSFVYKQKIGLHYTCDTTYEDVPSLLSLDSTALFDKSRMFTIRQFGVLASTAGKDENLQFDKASKVDRDCILWSVKVNKSTTGTSYVYAFNLSTMKRRVLASFTPSVAGIYEIPVNQPVYKDEYVAVSCAAISVSSGYGYAYTVDGNNNILTLSNGGRTENTGSVYTFLLDYASSFATNHFMYGAGLSQGSTIAIFGGSFSINGSRYVKTIYDNIVQPKAITHYGVGACGFIQGTTPIPTQIDNAIASGVMYDTWILWCSTNDCGQPVGQPTDAAGTTSQAAAMRLCINKIYAYNPYAKIVVFGSARAFSQAKFNEQNGQLHQLVQGQKAFCEYWDIPYLDQWEGIGINTINFAKFFDADQLHWNDRGYELACHRQAQFLINLV